MLSLAPPSHFLHSYAQKQERASPSVFLSYLKIKVKQRKKCTKEGDGVEDVKFYSIMRETTLPGTVNSQNPEEGERDVTKTRRKGRAEGKVRYEELQVKMTISST